MEFVRDITSIKPTLVVHKEYIKYVCALRYEHIVRIAVSYGGRPIAIPDAIDEAKCIIVPNEFNPDVSEQFLDYALVSHLCLSRSWTDELQYIMTRAMTQLGEERARDIEDDQEPLLSYTSALVPHEVPKQDRERICRCSTESLEHTEEKDMTDAGKTGPSDNTFETLQHFRGHIRDLGEEHLDLSMGLAWKISAVTLSRTFLRCRSPHE